MVNLAKWHQLRQHLFRECYDHSAVNVWLVGWLACEVWWHVLMSLYLVNVRGVLCRQCVAFGWLVGLWGVVVTCCDIASRPQLRPKPSKRHLWTHLCANLFVKENINHFCWETNFSGSLWEAGHTCWKKKGISKRGCRTPNTQQADHCLGRLVSDAGKKKVISYQQKRQQDSQREDYCLGRQVSGAGNREGGLKR